MTHGDLEYQAEIMGAAIAVLGRPWALLIIRDIAFLGLQRFTEILRHNLDLNERTLARRLRELCEAGILTKHAEGTTVRYEATEKGQDALWILFAFLRYGLRHHEGALAVRSDHEKDL